MKRLPSVSPGLLIEIDQHYFFFFQISESFIVMSQKQSAQLEIIVIQIQYVNQVSLKKKSEANRMSLSVKIVYFASSSADIY